MFTKELAQRSITALSFPIHTYIYSSLHSGVSSLCAEHVQQSAINNGNNNNNADCMHNQFNQKLNIICIYHLALANNKLNERYLRDICKEIYTIRVFRKERVAPLHSSHPFSQTAAFSSTAHSKEKLSQNRNENFAIFHFLFFFLAFSLSHRLPARSAV